MKSEKESLKDQIPEIYCALSVSAEENESISYIAEKFQQLGISEYEIITPKFDSYANINFAIVRNEKHWYLDDALTKMFSKIDDCLPQLKKIVDDYGAKLCIDIAFYQHGTYPALEFIGDNMSKIRFLEADISIDAF